MIDGGRRRRPAIVLLLVLLPLGCYGLASTYGGVPLLGVAYGELWTRLHFACSHYDQLNRTSFESTAKPLSQGGFVIAYRATCNVPGRGQLPVEGAAVCRSKGTGRLWNCRPSFGGSPHPGLPGAPLSAAWYYSGSPAGVLQSYIYGQVMVDQQLTIEGHFSDGSIVREVASEGMYLLLPGPSSIPCKLRVFDDQGNLLVQHRFIISDQQQHCARAP